MDEVQQISVYPIVCSVSSAEWCEWSSLAQTHGAPSIHDPSCQISAICNNIFLNSELSLPHWIYGRWKRRSGVILWPSQIKTLFLVFNIVVSGSHSIQPLESWLDVSVLVLTATEWRVLWWLNKSILLSLRFFLIYIICIHLMNWVQSYSCREVRKGVGNIWRIALLTRRYGNIKKNCSKCLKAERGRKANKEEVEAVKNWNAKVVLRLELHFKVSWIIYDFRTVVTIRLVSGSKLVQYEL